MEHTKGKVNLQKQGKDGIFIRIANLDPAICRVYNRNIESICEETKANAELIADAFNTTNESGLTPSQLYKQNQELLVLLQEIVDDMPTDERLYDGVGVHSDFAKELINKAQQAINNAKTK